MPNQTHSSDARHDGATSSSGMVERSPRSYLKTAQTSSALPTSMVRLRYVNPAGLRLVGLDNADEARRLSVLDFIPMEDRGVFRDEVPGGL